MSKNLRAIKCITNNTVYKSIKEASEKLGLTSSSISNVLSGRIKITKGYSFEYLEGGELRLALCEIRKLQKQVTALEQDKIDLINKVDELKKRPVKIITDTHRSKIELANHVNFLKRKTNAQREKIERLCIRLSDYERKDVKSECNKKKSIIKEMEYNGQRYD